MRHQREENWRANDPITRKDCFIYALPKRASYTMLMECHYGIYAGESGGHFQRIVKGRLEKGKIGEKESFYGKNESWNGLMFWLG